ncbi:MAG TPA: hypothetical protein VI248_22400, partial [Kineosporiaceae bacterium]
DAPVTPGPAFSPRSALTDHLRIAVVETPEILTEGVRRLARAWAVVSTQRLPRGTDGRELLLI